MDVSALRKWLNQPRMELVTAVAEGVTAHVAALRSRSIEFYGYALHPGEPYDIHSIVAVTNGKADISVSPGDDQYRYFRYLVDEWAHWHYDDVFTTANRILVELNERFKSMHSKSGDDCTLDEFEEAHANALLDAVMLGLSTAKQDGVFGVIEPFLVVWISDSDHRIIFESVKQLNSKVVAAEFVAEFGANQG